MDPATFLLSWRHITYIVLRCRKTELTHSPTHSLTQRECAPCGSGAGLLGIRIGTTVHPLHDRKRRLIGINGNWSIRISILQQVLSFWIHTPYFFYLDVNEVWIRQLFSCHGAISPVLCCGAVKPNSLTHSLSVDIQVKMHFIF